MRRQISIIIVLAGCLGLVNVSAQTPELAQAKAKLGALEKELAGLDVRFETDLAAALAEKVDSSPKGEFESTEEYKARLASAQAASAAIRPAYELRKTERKQAVEDEIRIIINLPYPAPIRIRLGRYDADTQLFKFEVRATGDSGNINIPLNIAEDLRINLSTLPQVGYWQLLDPKESTLRATSLIYDEVKYFGLIGAVDTTSYVEQAEIDTDSLDTLPTPHNLMPQDFLAAIGYSKEGITGALLLPPVLAATAAFISPTGNALTGNNNGQLLLTVSNSGRGPAMSIRALMSVDRADIRIADQRYLGTVRPGESRVLSVAVEGGHNLADGQATVRVDFSEGNGFEPDPLAITFNTRVFQAPILVIAEVGIDDANRNGILEAGELANIVARVMNNGPGTADGLRASISLGENLFFTAGQPTAFVISDLKPGMWTDLKFEIFANRQATEVPVNLVFSHIQGQYELEPLPVDLPFKQPARTVQQMTVEESVPAAPTAPASLLAIDIETDIPTGASVSKESVALIIANRNYQNRDIPTVEYAYRDGEFIRQYLIKTLGYREGNIFVYQDATLGNFMTALLKLSNAAKPTSDVFVYYTGHGAPDPESKSAYFVPVDSDPNYITTGGFALEDFYGHLSGLEVNSITVVLDACFSGGSDQGMIIRNVSPVFLEVADLGQLADHVTAFSSSSGEEVSSWYPEQRHSLYTYFFLKGFQGVADSDGDRTITIGEMQVYLEGMVPYTARRLNNRKQTPQVTPGRGDRVLVRLD
ncbi:caspase family protein [Candidatus Neomarinimicrobiota bacterium]